jgi:hypothetical protein
LVVVLVALNGSDIGGKPNRYVPDIQVQQE